MNFLEILKQRGYFHQCTHEAQIEALTEQGQVIFYTGFDCTAPSLHVGHLMQIMNLRLLQRLGHKPIVLVGGGTTKVGDPSGRDETRSLLSPAQILDNAASIQAILSQFIRFGDGPSDAILVNNADWLDKLNYIDFLSEYGRHFSINRMLSFDSVKLRLEREQNLSFLEFNYMILQAYDFVELSRNYQCRVQIGGSDQWGNIVNGIELNRRLGGIELYGITTPLITTANGAKMGKSVSGAIWLKSSLLSPFEYFQFWRNCDDADTFKFLKLFTELDMKEIQVLETLQGRDINKAKKILAYEATKICHGLSHAKNSLETAEQTFEQGLVGRDIPIVEIDKEHLKNGILIYDLLTLTKLSSSKSEARRLVRGKGAKINDRTIEDEYESISDGSKNSQGLIKLSAGKKHIVMIKPA